MRALCLILLLLAVGADAVQASVDPYTFASEAQRERYRVLTEELRCPKCQNQSLADSNAPIAVDLRGQIHQRLMAGDSDRQILDYLTARYGDFVLYRPHLTVRTLLLWFTPAILLVSGGLCLLLIARRRKAGSPSLSAAERSKLASLLEDTPAHEDLR